MLEVAGLSHATWMHGCCSPCMAHETCPVCVDGEVVHLHAYPTGHLIIVTCYVGQDARHPAGVLSDGVHCFNGGQVEIEGMEQCVYWGGVELGGVSSCLLEWPREWV